jgi:hypothetical protein
MANQFQNALSNIARSAVGRRQSLSKTIVQNQIAQGAGPAVGTVLALDTDRRSAQIQLPNGNIVEYYMQNRYVQQGKSVGAIGFRIL